MDFRAEYEKWCTDPYFDEATKAELKAIAGDDKEIEDRFYRTLEFGTAGLRGVIGAGTNRMNIYTVRQATQGLANYILSQGEDAVKRGVAIAHDSRNMHDEFTDATALCLAANGIKTYVFPQLAPVPELSYAVRTLGTIAGVVITASHNPREYNGYKVYWEDGAQVTPPHDTSIMAETCASIGLVFFAKQMLKMSKNGKYADVMERELYNGIISGMQLDGKRFFYVNPLEVNPGVSGEIFGYKHVIPERPGWYACACCPPNLVRMVTSLGRYAWDEDDDVIYSHLFIGQKARLKKADIKVVSEYPWKGHVSYSITPKTGDEFAVAIHIPGYLKSFEVTLNGMRLKETGETKADLFYSYRDGYIYIKNKWHDNDVIEISFNMDIRVIYANTKVREDIGCAALQRGPVVYAFEGVDNDDDVQSLMIDVSRLNEAQIETEAEGILKGAVLLDIPAVRLEGSDALYSEKPPRQKSVIARAIPYYMWGNRGLNQMRVWMHTIYN